MGTGQDYYQKIEPNVVQRECGGWLATAPKWSPLRIGVTAATETDVREAFRLALDHWATLLSLPN